MKQVFLNSDLLAEIVEVDIPAIGPGDILVAVRSSLVSTGTETAGYDAGSLVGRSLRDPSKVRQVYDAVRQNGLAGTYRKIQEKRHQLTARGYSGAGVVVRVGEEVRRFAVGDRVAYAGAPHAEYVAVPEQLAAHLPEVVSFDEGAFGAVACIALHGVRLAEPTLGETAIVVGLGLVGLLSLQFARLSGLRVIGIEPVRARRELARELGAEIVVDPGEQDDMARFVTAHTGGYGADAAFLCAGAKNSAITNTAMDCCRDRGRVVMVGDMGLELSRRPLFGKELSFRVSRSYGPGRYDRRYEQKGVDYPIGFVRWTEGRNLEYYLDAVAAGRINVRAMISSALPFEEASNGYARLTQESQSTLAIILRYPDRNTVVPTATPLRRTAIAPKARADRLRIGVIGAGAFVSGNLLPLFRELDAELYGVANRTATAFSKLTALYSPRLLTTSTDELLDDDNVDAVVVATRHNLHARLALDAIARGKPVHVEKPLAIRAVDAERVAQAARDQDALVTIGFNRRFAPHVLALRDALRDAPAPRHFLYRVNAPLLPLDHWTLDPEEGGGRLIGEACHFVDLVCYLAGAEVLEVQGAAIGGRNPAVASADNASINLRFANGDLATVVYSAQGNSKLGKERLEVFAGGRVFVLDDYESIHGYGATVSAAGNGARDKGFRGHLANFFSAVRGDGVLVTTADDGVRVARILEQVLNPLES